jgi:PAS domain S-box-containing protein
MSDAVLIADAHGQITQINAAYRALVGLPPDQQIPRDPAAHIAQLAIRDHDGQPVPFDEMVTQRAVRGQRILNEAAVDYQFRTLGGEDRWASATAAPLYDAQGQISGAITVLRDVTERRQAERALQRAHERFQLAERAANGFVYEWDVRAGQLYRSAGVERLLGYRPEEIPPTWEAWAQLVYPGDWQATTDAEELAYLEALPAETLETAYRLRHRDGHYLTVADYALLERDAAGHIVRLIGQTHDITQRKRAEEALRRSHVELEQRVAERTHDLDMANRSLRRLSQRILEIQEGERRLIARELHDEVGQQLTGAKMLLDSLEEQLHEGSNDATEEHLSEAQVPPASRAACRSTRRGRGHLGACTRSLAGTPSRCP